PVAGKLTDRINPKIPLLFGITILGITMYLFGFLSMHSMRDQIMIPMYLRGLGMGFVFTPLSTVALYDIPRPQLAQASGLMNTVRQIGGSFGIAALGTLLTQRVKFHTQTFGEQLNQSSPVFQNTIEHLQKFSADAIGANHITAAAAAKTLLMKNLSIQAFVQGINDDFLVGAALTILLLVPMLLLRTSKKHLNR
ncbi:MAG TPA: MFS transporter, partial [Bacteroidales bacterium]|nr:MFS transporter [Bacteroidales bacterium]